MAKRQRTARQIWEALQAAGAEPHKVDGLIVTTRIEDRVLVEDLRDAIVAQAVKEAEREAVQDA